jgi:flagellar hook-basal body protein
VADIFVVLFCLGGISGSLWYFWSDLNRTLGRQNEVPVGYITYKNKAAQRRFYDRVLWDRLQMDAPIYNGDFIHTADLSEATITFKDGGVIDLGENSFIQVFADAEGARVDLTSGNISADAQSGSIALHTGSTVVDINNGSAVTAATGENGLNVQVGSGNVTVSDETGEVKALGAGDFLANAAGGPVVGVSAPKPNAKVVAVGDSTGVRFEWRRANFAPGDRVLLEIAADREFKKIKDRSFIDGERTTVTLGPGLWFWRAMGVAADSDTPAAVNLKNAVTSYVTVVRAAAVELTSPKSEEVILYRFSVPSLRFQWAAVPALTDITGRFLLEVANNSAFASPAIAATVDNTSFTVTTLGAGTWFWRVTPVLPATVDAPPLASPPASFTIRQSDTLAAPVLLNPEDRSIVALGNRTPGLVSGTGDLRFTWKLETEAASYTLIVADNPGLNAPVINQRVTTNYYIYNLNAGVLQEKQYYWTVTQSAAKSSTKAFAQDGYTMGFLNSFKIDNAGSITGVYSNGTNRLLGQIAMASFTNQGGLEKAGDNTYVESNNSGTAEIGASGSAGKGSLLAGALEMSNVDLTEQFTDMIVTQRGFQASSKTIQTADTLLETVLGLKR